MFRHILVPLSLAEKDFFPLLLAWYAVRRSRPEACPGEEEWHLQSAKGGARCMTVSLYDQMGRTMNPLGKKRGGEDDRHLEEVVTALQLHPIYKDLHGSDPYVNRLSALYGLHAGARERGIVVANFFFILSGRSWLVLWFFERNPEFLVETDADFMYLQRVLGESPQYPYLGAKHTVDTNLWSVFSAYTAFLNPYIKGDRRAITYLLEAQTLAGAEVALHKNFVSLGGDLGFTHAFEYLHIIDREHHLMAWTRHGWETVPAQLIRDGPNARVFQRWAGAARADAQAATRSALPVETVWARPGAGGAPELRTVAFPRWNAADLQQTECKAVQVCEAFVCRQYGAHRRHAPPKLIAPDRWDAVNVVLVPGAPGRMFQVPWWKDEVHAAVRSKRKLVDPAAADASSARRRLVGKCPPLR